MAPAPVMHPATAAPTSAPQSNAPLGTATIDGSAAFVTAADFPVYEFSGDTTDVSNCTGGCLTTWPAVTPPPVTLPAGWTAFMRPDTHTMQLAYNGAPLYTYSGDTPGVSNGTGIEDFSLARPAAAATPTGAPTTMPGSPY